MVFLSLAFAQPQTIKGLEVLPPEQLSSGDVVLSLSTDTVYSTNRLFLNIENRSNEKFSLNKIKDLSFVGQLPESEGLGLGNEIVAVLPGEAVRLTLNFPERKFRSGEIQKFKIFNQGFLVRYWEQPAPTLNLIPENSTQILYYGRAQLALKKFGERNIVLENISTENITELYLSWLDSSNNVALFKVSPKLWQGAYGAALSSANLLIKTSRSPDYSIYPLSGIFKGSYLPPVKVIKRPADQYLLTIYPNKISRGKYLRISVQTRYAPRIERITAQFEREEFSLQPVSKLVWQKDFCLPENIPLGYYFLKVFIKDDKGLLVLTEYFEVT